MVACIRTVPDVVPDLPEVFVIDENAISECVSLGVIKVEDGRMPNGGNPGYSSNYDRAIRRLKHSAVMLGGNAVVVGELWILGLTMDGRGDKIELEGMAYRCPDTIGLSNGSS